MVAMRFVDPRAWATVTKNDNKMTVRYIGIFRSVYNCISGAFAQTAVMGTWAGLTAGSFYLLGGKLYPKQSSTFWKLYGVWFGITRCLWMNRSGRFLRPTLPRTLQEYILSSLTHSALRWHNPHDKLLVVTSKSQTLPAEPVVFLNEPHGVGNGILPLLHFAMSSRKLNPSKASKNISPIVLGSKNVCLVPFLAEFCWIFCGKNGFEFAEDVNDLKRALASGRDVTLVPSGFSTIGTGGQIDWSRRKKFFKLLYDCAAEEKRPVNLLPVCWFYELCSYTWFTSSHPAMEKLRVKLRLPIGAFAFGHNPILFYLPKRGPQLIGAGGLISLSPESEPNVPKLKLQLKTEYDRVFEECRQVWNSETEGQDSRMVEKSEWNFKVQD
ncbi:hypothetical protein TrLO_g11077 [Triparma laevis f. longispina]|uniref:Uncharacterized protein n=1 Tax=Triparma laevis f. longispina TaxID=1714387 RepID=A0A9W7FIU2_9STRA|nr:hypothetical protein TrLO_g11077 [Triparma laevis f. longispina]